MRAPPPAIEALLWQTAATVLVAGIVLLADIEAPGAAIASSIGLLAALATWLRGLDRWWLLIQLLFAPAIWLFLQLQMSPLAYFGAFALLALVYWSTFRTQVPLFLSGRDVWRAVASLLPPADAQRPLHFIDLGSGLGGLLGWLGRNRPDGSYVGIEVAPLPALLSRLRFAAFGPANVQVNWGSFWERDLAPFDVVFAFLSPVPMPELWLKASREMRPGSLLVSCSFDVPGHPPDHVIEVSDSRRSRLLVWRMR